MWIMSKTTDFLFNFLFNDLSCSEKQVYILTLSITEQRLHKHLMKIKKQNIYVAKILGEIEQGVPTFLKNLLNILGLSFYPLKFWKKKQSITPGNLAKLCYTPQKFQDQKQRPQEILHDF